MKNRSLAMSIINSFAGMGISMDNLHTDSDNNNELPTTLEVGVS